jgi:V8-like Glu-specific endopeptidase
MNSSGQWIGPWHVYRGRDGSSTTYPYGDCLASWAGVAGGFPSNMGGTTYDWGAIRLDTCTVPGSYGAGIEPIVVTGEGNNNLYRDLVWKDGWPGEKLPLYSLWESAGAVCGCDATTWANYIDDTGGQSGGPMIVPSAYCLGWSECVVGHMVGSTGGTNMDYRMQAATVSQLAYWRDVSPGGG